MSETNELDLLKARAAQMGIKHSPNIGIETLKQKIDEVLNGGSNDSIEEEEGRVLSKREYLNQYRNTLRKEALKLVRIRVTDLDPKKKDLPGEILCCANEFIGSVKRYVPYNGEPWHVEQCILNMMRDKEFLNIKTTKGKNDAVQVDKKWVKEYAIEILPELSKEELTKLAAAQAAAGI